MSRTIAYQDILKIISNLHSFVDEAESAIAAVYDNYSSSQQQIEAKHIQDLNSIAQQYNAQQNSVKSQANALLSDAQSIFQGIVDLEDQLTACDKYFVKTKAKKEQELFGKQEERYTQEQDYFEILNDIKSRFQTLVVKYTNRGHRGIIDGLNYLVSSQRKQDYEELIVLKNTVSNLIEEINNTIPSITEESLSSFDQAYVDAKQTVESNYARNIAYNESAFSQNVDNVADQICQRIDAILPDSLIEELKSAIDQYESQYGKLDSSRETFGDYIILGHVVYPYAELIESPVLIELIKNKCEKLIIDNELHFPVMCSLDNSFNWLIESDEISTSNVSKMTHSVMLGFLSFSPVSKVQFCVCDFENRGNSVIPFLELRKKLPDVFMGKVLTTQEEIHDRLYNISNGIDDFIQNKLGNKYANIFEYNEANPGHVEPITVLVLYDFPKGFDERNIAELKNILKNGNKCGIFALICYNKKTEISSFNDLSNSIELIKNQCATVLYSENSFWLNGLELKIKSIPSSDDINAFADKYVLITEGRKNKGLIFPPLVRKLFALQGEKQSKYISRIVDIQKQYSKLYGAAEYTPLVFPEAIMLGSICYPREIFSQNLISECTKQGLISNRSVELPFTCELDSQFHVLLTENNENAEAMTVLSHVMLISFISEIPAGKINISVFDCEKRGNSIAPFLEFRKLLPDIFDNQIYTSQDAITEKLTRVNAYIDEFIQDKLGTGFSDFFAYNAEAAGKEEPAQLLVIYDFPKCFDNRSYEMLLNILKNGSKCGVYTIILYNPDITVSRYDSHEEYLNQIKKYSTCFEFKDGSYYLCPYNLPLKINKMLSQSEIHSFTQLYAQKVDNEKNKSLSFKDIVASNLFAGNSAGCLKIPMGVGSGNTVVNLILGEGSSHHGLIAGATGSGKSTLLHTLIMSAMLNYSPDQLNLYLMDFKSGTEFKIYDSVRLSHIKLLALDAMQEFGESILEDLVAEMSRRGELFKSVGQTSLKGYTEASGQSLPRILVIMDEFQILFNDASNRKIAVNCAELTKRIVTEGRAFGIHLLMATQSTKVIRDLTLQQGTIEQMRVRIGLKCGEDDARYLFTDRNDVKALELMKGPIGTAVLNQEYMESSNVGFRTAYCDKELQREYLQLIASKYAFMNAKPQVFEGNRVTALTEYLKKEQITDYAENITKVFFGEKIKVAPPFVLDIDRRRKHNMLVCGANETMAENLMNLYMISALLNRSCTMYCFDGDMIVGDGTSAEVYRVFENYSNRFHVSANRGEIITSIREVYQKYKDNKVSGDKTSVFVFVKNLQWLDLVQKMLKDEAIDENEYLVSSVETPQADPSNPFDWGIDDSSPAQSEGIAYQFKKMIDDGSACGIYFIFECTEYAVVRECMYYADNILSKIPERIIFSLSDNDADTLIDGVSVSQMKDNTVYFTDGVKNTFQFKPFLVRSADEIRMFLENETQTS